MDDDDYNSIYFFNGILLSTTTKLKKIDDLMIEFSFFSSHKFINSN